VGVKEETYYGLWLQYCYRYFSMTREFIRYPGWQSASAVYKMWLCW